MKKMFFFFVILLCGMGSFAQSQGYWSNHAGLDIGAGFLRFDQPQTVLPAGSSVVPGLTGSLFFDFIRMRETPSRDIPVWGIKFKFNLQAVGYKVPSGTIYYADEFTFPLLLKLTLLHSEGYYTMYYDRGANQYVPRYHDRGRFALYLYAGPQYEYVYGKNSYADDFKNKALAGGLYGNISGLAGLEFNFETFLFDVGWQQAMQPVYYDGNPLKSSGLLLRLGLTFNNVYRHYH